MILHNRAWWYEILMLLGNGSATNLLYSTILRKLCSTAVCELQKEVCGHLSSRQFVQRENVDTIQPDICSLYNILCVIWQYG